MPPSSRSYLRVLTAKIHPQLPLDPRQSQQLLSILSTSFQKQLDLAHPPVGADQDSASPFVESKTSTLLDRKNGNSNCPVTPQVSTAKHFESVLTNPLLKIRPNPNLFIFGGEKIIKNHPETLAPSFSRLEEAQRWFAEYVACGEADLTIAKTYLHTVQTLKISQPATSQHGVVGSDTEVRAGEDVIQWLLSIPIQDTNKNLFDVEFCSILTRSIVEGQRYQKFSTLLAHISSFALHFPRTRHHSERALVQALVQSSVKAMEHTEDVVQTFMDIVAAYQEWLPIKKCSRVKRVFGPAANRVAENLAANNTKVAVSTYDRFLHSLGELSNEKSVADAMLRLYHPTTPDAAALISLLSSATMVENLAATSPSKRRAVVQMCLDAVQLLLSQGRNTSASSVLDFASQNLTKELGLEQDKQSLAMQSQTHDGNESRKRRLKKRDSEELQDMSIFAVG